MLVEQASSQADHTKVHLIDTAQNLQRLIYHPFGRKSDIDPDVRKALFGAQRQL